MVSDTFFHSQARIERRRLKTAIALSLAVHAAAVFMLNRAPTHSVDKTIEISLVQVPPDRPAEPKQPAHVPPPPREQIVTPSESVPEPPKPTRFRSEHDSRAEKEIIKRGDSLVKPKAAPKPEPLKEQVAPRPPAEAKLRLSEEQLQRTLTETSPSADLKLPEKEIKESESVRKQKFQLSEPFRRSYSASLLSGKSGSSDYLPEIPDGDITLLNAKADRYAVFVRRVALQVFGALRKLNWADLDHTELRRLSQFTTVEAVMDKNGKLVRVTVKDSSGSSRFDAIAEKAASLGSWDQNPPADAAASDGMIHFVFQARSWSRMSQGGIGEQRWLLLGTGLL